MYHSRDHKICLVYNDTYDLQISVAQVCRNSSEKSGYSIQAQLCIYEVSVQIAKHGEVDSVLPVCYVSMNTGHVQYLFKSQEFSSIHEVCTSVELVSSFVYTAWVSIMRISHYLIPVGYGYFTIFLFSIPCGSIYHARTFLPR